MRAGWLLLALVGCAGDDPHEIGACDPAWGSNVTSCEAACEAGPTNETGFGTCKTGMAGPLVTYCMKAYERDGGCCARIGAQVRWYECLP